MILYAGVVLVCTWLAASMEKKPALLKLFFCILTAALVAGLRAKTVGNDTPGYYLMFESIGERVFVREFAFLLYIKIFMGITGSAQACIFITALITNWLMILGFWKMRKYVSFGKIMFAYMCIPFFLTMSGIRQWLSISIICYGLHFILERKYIKYLFCMVLATLFHYSSVVSFAYLGIAILLNNTGKLNTIKVLKNIGILLASGVAIAAGYMLVNNEYQSYLSSPKLVTNTGLMASYRFLIFILYILILLVEKRKRAIQALPESHDDANRPASPETLITVLAGVGFLLWAVSTYASQFMLNVGRIGWVFLLSEGLLFAWFSKKKTILNQTGKYAMVVMFLYTLYSNIYMDGNMMVPYKFFWMRLF